MINCSCGSTYLRKNKGQHRSSHKHQIWLRDERWAQCLNRELDQLIVNSNTIQPPMEPPSNHLENGVPRGDPSLENKEPLIIDSPVKLPERINVNIHCNRCTELKTALEVIGAGFGIVSFALVLWLIAKK